MKSNIIFLIILVLVILIIFCFIINSANTCTERYNNYLTGMWVGDPDFLKQSKLQDLQIFIAPSDNKNSDNKNSDNKNKTDKMNNKTKTDKNTNTNNKNLRQGYIIMTDLNGNFIINDPVEFKEKINSNKKWNALNANSKKNKDKFTTQYETTTENIVSNFPKNIKFNLSMCDGTLSIYDSDSNILVALLEKDLISSAAAIEAYL